MHATVGVADCATVHTVQALPFTRTFQLPSSIMGLSFVVYWSARLSHLVSLDHVLNALNAEMCVFDGSISDVTNTESLCSESRDVVESQADETVFAIHD